MSGTFSAGDLKWGQPTLGTPSGEITWSSDLTGLDYNTGKDSIAEFQNTLQSAFDRWEGVAAINFTHVDATASPDVTFSLTNIDGAGNTAGLANFTYTSGSGIHTILSGDITLDNSEFWSPDGTGGTDFYAVALHEIGHILGLGHVDDPTQIMNPVVSAHDLGNGDIAGAQYLYGTNPGDPVVDVGTPVSAPTVSDSGGGGGGGGGGAIALVFGLIAALIGSLFGGGGAAVAAMAAGHVPDDHPSDPQSGDGHGDASMVHDHGDAVLLSDLIPTVEHDHEDDLHHDDFEELPEPALF